MYVIVDEFYHIDHKKVLISEFNVSQTYFELASISKNQGSNFRGFTVYVRC